MFILSVWKSSFRYHSAISTTFTACITSFPIKILQCYPLPTTRINIGLSWTGKFLVYIFIGVINNSTPLFLSKVFQFGIYMITLSIASPMRHFWLGSTLMSGFILCCYFHPLLYTIPSYFLWLCSLRAFAFAVPSDWTVLSLPTPLKLPLVIKCLLIPRS